MVDDYMDTEAEKDRRKARLEKEERAARLAKIRQEQLDTVIEVRTTDENNEIVNKAWEQYREDIKKRRAEKAKREKAKLDALTERINTAESPEELAAIMAGAGMSVSTDSEMDYEKYVPAYVKKRHLIEKQRKEDTKKKIEEMEDIGKPFVPPVKTEDVAGL